MSGFSPAWLALREPADHRARNRELVTALGAHFAEQSQVRVLDLGSGTGSNLRALAPVLPSVQEWRLVDHDATLLDAARTQLSAWADETHPDGGALQIAARGKEIDVRFVAVDLSIGIDTLLDPALDLVTAAALFDLVSQEWLAALAASLAAARLPLYGALTVDGGLRFGPAHRHDAAVAAAFHAHMHGDKGFGAAAGTMATQLLADALGKSGYRISVGRSPWQLDGADAPLIDALLDGIADAVAETGRIDRGDLVAWRAARRATTSCEIGHLDLFATPP